MGYNIFYKIGTSSALHVASVKTINDFSSLLPYSSEITTGTNRFYLSNEGSIIDGQFPSPDLSSTVYYYNMSVQAPLAVNTYTTILNGTNIYKAATKSAFEAAGGSALISIPADTTTVFNLCDSKGYTVGVSYTITATCSEHYVFVSIMEQYDDYSGTLSYSVFGRYTVTTMNSRELSDMKFFFFTTTEKDLGIIAGISYGGSVDDRAQWDGYGINSHLLTYKDESDTSPSFVLLNSKNAIYGASGSDDADGSEESGGLGNFDFSNSDIIPDDDIPSVSPAITAGLVNPYYVTASEIASLGNFLWSSDFFDSIAKTFSNPMDCIISLASFPVASSSMSLGSSESVRVGNTTSASTGTRLISEFITIDCGSVSIPEVWGSYLDYAQTKLYIYIPYLGIEELPLCECMGGSVACELRINLLTGALVACVTLTSGSYVTGSARKQPIYFSTTCKSDIPVSGATTGALAGAFQLLGGATSAIAGVATGVAPLAISGLASTAQGVATMQSQNSQISGAVGAAGGQMAHKIPFLIFDRPVQSVPANLSKIAGYQSNSGTTLSNCSGYVICDTINLDGLSLTRSELEEVEQICTSGVYIS